MLLVFWVTYILTSALLGQVLCSFVPTTNPKPRDGPRVRFPQETQPQIAISASQSTSLVSPTATAIISIPITTLPGCSLAAAMLSFCDDISPGFSTFSYTDQTSCLCYPNTTTWRPEIFDDAVLTCAELVSTVTFVYSQVASLVGFCTRPASGGGNSTIFSSSTESGTSPVTRSIASTFATPSATPTETVGALPTPLPGPLQSMLRP